MKKVLSHYNKGFGLIEIMISISIITFTLIGFLSLLNKTIEVSNRALKETQAALLLEEGAEAIKIIRATNWGTISGFTNGIDYYPTFAGGTWVMSTTPNTIDNFFTRKVAFSSVSRDASSNIVSSGGTLDSGTKLATITVSWATPSGSITKTLQLYVSNIY